MIKKLIAITSMLSFSFVSSGVLASGWKQIEGGKYSEDIYSITCEDKNGWSKCGEEKKDNLYLSLTRSSVGNFIGIVSGEYSNPPLDSIIYCDPKNSISILTMFYTDNLTYEQAVNVLGYKLDHPDFVDCPKVNPGFNVTPVPGVDTLGNMQTQMNSYVYYDGNPYASNPIICGIREKEWKQYYRYKSSSYGISDHHILCSKTILNNDNLKITPDIRSQSYNPNNVIPGGDIWSYQRTPKLKPEITHIVSDQGNRYRVGPAALVVFKPDMSSGMDIWNAHTSYYPLTKE